MDVPKGGWTWALVTWHLVESEVDLSHSVITLVIWCQWLTGGLHACSGYQLNSNLDSDSRQGRITSEDLLYILEHLGI